MTNRLTLSALLIGIVVLAAVGFAQNSLDVRYFNLPGRTGDLLFSNVVLVGDTLYLGGSPGIDPATGAPPPHIRDEAKIAMEGIKQRLALAGDQVELNGWYH